MRKENTRGRTMLGLLAGLVLLALAPAASAEISIPGMNFSPNPNDESLKMLGTFFGTADGIVKGSSPVMAALMNIFNGAVLALASIFAFYTIVSAVVQTAHDGEVLGKRYSSLWVPIRSAGGIAAIVPAGGYSAVQMMVLWIAAQGVGLANQLWVAGVDSLADKGGFATQVQMAEDGRLVVAQLIPIAACLQANSEEIAKSGNPDGAREDVNVTPSGVDYGFVMANSRFVSCGRVNFKFDDGASEVKRRIYTAQSNAVVGAMNAIRPAIASLGDPQGGGPAVLENAAKQYDQTVFTAAQAAIDAAANTAKTKYASEIAALKDKGWSAAGGSFMTLSKLSQSVDTKLDASSFDIAPAQGQVYGTDVIRSRMEGLASQALSKAGGETGGSGDGVTSKINDLVGKPFKKMQDGIVDEPIVYGHNPIVYWKGMGDKILNWVGGVLIGILVASAIAAGMEGAGKSTLGAIVTATPMGAAAKGLIAGAVDVLGKLFYMFLFVSVGFVTIGVMLAYYVPMLPYIVWVSVLLAWLVAVAEAVIASPLWMMLHLNPEGDGVGSGGTEAGYKFVAATFLRPALSVIAFFVACSIMFAVGGFVNISLKEVFAATRAENSAFAPSSLFAIGGVFFIGMSLALAIVTKSFGLCMTIPETILRWIGSSLTGGEDLSREAKGEFHGAAGVVVGGTQQGLRRPHMGAGTAGKTPPPPGGKQPDGNNGSNSGPDAKVGAAGGRDKVGDPDNNG